MIVCFIKSIKSWIASITKRYLKCLAQRFLFLWSIFCKKRHDKNYMFRQITKRSDELSDHECAFDIFQRSKAWEQKFKQALKWDASPTDAINPAATIIKCKCLMTNFFDILFSFTPYHLISIFKIPQKKQF